MPLPLRQREQKMAQQRMAQQAMEQQAMEQQRTAQKGMKRNKIPMHQNEQRPDVQQSEKQSEVPERTEAIKEEEKVHIEEQPQPPKVLSICDNFVKLLLKHYVKFHAYKTIDGMRL